MASKRYEINLPLDGGNEAVTYEVSGSGTITIEKVDGVSADNLPAHKRDKLIAAIKAAPSPGNELPEGAAGTKPVDPAAPARPDQGLPGVDVNPNPDVNVNPELSRPDVPDNALPEGPPATPDNELPEAPEPKA